jgi:hypothetical protein
MKNKVRLIQPTWENSRVIISGISKLKIGQIYTIAQYNERKDRAKLVEGYWYDFSHTNGWWYDLRDFKEVIPELNSNIKIL